ncbi:hypothetical protein HXX76_008520 [Chlamydomonas incerta]|uniref:H/ACA ribonucleoprotein complex non-core subunit NAF1 n=1 Tax=Chlamydomonas incerta TaxID=51695 RepID=A0A835SUT3_CHLIN|nr:hypothetical protein HXX76_008520 [Chlamydomonas incerta]|eukprot:KAG2433463.1 hypothetical protein HXX76_008520 [Chlamydomonas incerta]
MFELPSVDDLEVAAAAAAAALEVLAPAQKRRADSSDDDSSDDSSSDEDSDSDDDSDEDSEEAGGALASDRATGGVSLQLQVDDATGRVVVRLAASGDADDVAMREAETDSSPLTSSSSSSDDEAEAAAATSRMVDDEELEALDHDGLRDLITRAYAVADAEDGEEEEGGGGGGGRNALQDLGLPAEAPELGADVVVTSEDAMEPAGTCLSVLEGMVVMQGLANSRPLADGSVVVAEDRTPLGVVEEVFGPVTQPLYAFRHVVKGRLPDCVKPGAALFVVPRLAKHITADEIYGGGRPGRGADPEPASDDEVYFSDDEAEQHYLRQQVSKRKGGPEGGQAGVAAEGGAAGGGSRPRQRTKAATRGGGNQEAVAAADMGKAAAAVAGEAVAAGATMTVWVADTASNRAAEPVVRRGTKAVEVGVEAGAGQPYGGGQQYAPPPPAYGHQHQHPGYPPQHAPHGGPHPPPHYGTGYGAPPSGAPGGPAGAGQQYGAPPVGQAYYQRPPPPHQGPYNGPPRY